MKKKMVLGIIAIAVTSFLFAFTLFHDKPIAQSKQNSYGAGVTNLRVLSRSGNNVTFGWDGINSPDHYNYGGYYQSGGSFSGTAYGNAITIQGGSSGRFGVTAICSDGSSGGSQNILF